MQKKYENTEKEGYTRRKRREKETAGNCVWDFT